MQKCSCIFPTDFKLRFYLRDPRATKPTAIVISIRWRTNRINFTHGLKVMPDQWDQTRQRAIVSHRLPEIYNITNEKLNQCLEQEERRFKEIIIALSETPEIITTFAEFIHRNFMSKKICRYTKAAKLDIFREIENAVLNNCSVGEGTQSNYINKGLKALKAYSEYRKASGCYAITSFEDIDNDLIDGFVEYLCSGKYRQENGEPYSMGTLNSIIKYAVSAVKCLPVMYLPKSKSALLKAPQLKDKTADNEIALTDKEVMLLWNYTPEKDSDREILDMFLLECTSGQRVSDLPKIGESMQERNGILYISIVQEKTSAKLDVPIIFQIAKEILNRYKSGLPKVGKDKINKNIKRIASEAGITGIATVSRHFSGSDKPTVTKQERSALISSHTGRRTFVSLLSVRGWNYEEIGKYTGHTNIKTVQNYDKSTAMDRQEYKKLSASEKVRMIEEDIRGISHLSVGQKAKDAVDILMSAGRMLGIRLAPKGRLNLLTLSQKFQAKKEEIISSYGDSEYQKIRKALQFGHTEEEQELLNSFFCMAMPKWHDRPVIVVCFEAAQQFWHSVEEEERNENEKSND